MRDNIYCMNMDQKAPHLTTKRRYKKRKKKPSLLPLARDPFYIPPPPEEIKKNLEIYFKRLPELKPKQNQAIEMFLDYVGKNKKPEICNIAKKLKMDSRSLTAYLVHDRNFSRVLEMAINRAQKSNLMISFLRICCLSMHQDDPERWVMELMIKCFALSHYNDFRRKQPGSNSSFIAEEEVETSEVGFFEQDA